MVHIGSTFLTDFVFVPGVLNKSKFYIALLQEKQVERQRLQESGLSDWANQPPLNANGFISGCNTFI